jgi:hypothetical protein
MEILKTALEQIAEAEFDSSALHLADVAKQALKQWQSAPMNNEELKKAREQLYFWQYSNEGGSNFTALVYLLFQKADASNLVKLQRGFPAEAQAFREWNAAESQEACFKEWGLIP